MHHIELIPVIELEPHNYKKGNYDSPNKSISEVPEAWEAYNQKAYADAGLYNAKAIKTGSWLFELEQFDKAQLTIILTSIYEQEEKDHLKEIFRDPKEYAPYFCGGFAFKVSNKIKALPGCCCGLESIEDWKEVLESESGQVWLGHDLDAYVNYTVQGDTIQFEVNTEIFEISKKAFTALLNDIELKLDALITTSGAILNDLFAITNGHEVASGMIYK